MCSEGDSREGWRKGKVGMVGMVGIVGMTSWTVVAAGKLGWE